MATGFSWTPQPLDEKDEELVRAYVDIGKPLDNLPYTDEFNRLVQRIKAGNTDPDKHAVFTRLLTLRKQGRLPRVTALSS
jgi:hypothetical protein